MTEDGQRPIAGSGARYCGAGKAPARLKASMLISLIAWKLPRGPLPAVHSPHHHIDLTCGQSPESRHHQPTLPKTDQVPCQGCIAA